MVRTSEGVLVDGALTEPASGVLSMFGDEVFVWWLRGKWSICQGASHDELRYSVEYHNERQAIFLQWL
jgi:hypothetical protein